MSMRGANPDRPSFFEKLAYAAPGFALGGLSRLIAAVIPTFYAKNTEVSLVAVGSVLLVTRIFDAIFHPLVGFASDSGVQRMGRKPWVLLGGFLSPIAIYYLFDPSATARVTYFAVWLTLTFAGGAVLEIPLRAWGAELSRHHADRSSIFAFLAQSALVGSVLFLAAPLLPAFSRGEITSPHYMHWAAVAISVALPLAVLWAVTGARSGPVVARERSTLGGLIRSVAANTPFWIFAAVYAISGIGSGLYNSVVLIYLINYLGIGKAYPIFAVLYYIITVPAISGWSAIMNRIGKPLAWAIGLGTLAAVLPLYWFVKPGPFAFPLLIAFTVLFSLAASASYLIPTTMIGDIVDYDTLKSGVNRSGNYYALLQLVQTFEVAIGGGLGFILLGAFGYHATGANGNFANAGLKIVLFVLPAVLFAVSAAVILYFPITMPRHEIIRRRLAQRTERLERALTS
jgi:glycoside/pentoside/hexuronide:cation symporter, GPH family